MKLPCPVIITLTHPTVPPLITLTYETRQEIAHCLPCSEVAQGCASPISRPRYFQCPRSAVPQQAVGPFLEEIHHHRYSPLECLHRSCRGWGRHPLHPSCTHSSERTGTCQSPGPSCPNNAPPFVDDRPTNPNSVCWDRDYLLQSKKCEIKFRLKFSH